MVIKRTARKLLERFPDAFKPDFEENKKILAGISGLEMEKKNRNSIAGYITRLVKTGRKK